MSSTPQGGDPDAPPPRHDYLSTRERPSRHAATPSPGGGERRAAGTGSSRSRPAASEYYRGTRQPVRGAPTPRRGGLADRRGLTTPGAVVLAGALTLVGAVADAETAAPSDATLRTLFTICFGVGSLAAVLLAHRERARAVVVAVPLLYALAALLGGLIYAHRNAEGLFKQGGLDAVTSLVTHAPTLLVVTGLGALIAYLRRRATRLPAAGPRPRPPAGRSGARRR